MANPTYLRVRLQGCVLVANHDAFEAGVRRYIGMRIDRERAGAAIPGEHAPMWSPDQPTEHPWSPTDEAEQVSDCKGHRDALRQGHLAPADEATARAVFGAQWRDHLVTDAPADAAQEGSR